MSQDDKAFAGAIPQVYEKLLVPLIFEPYAADLVRRIARRKPSRILEIAAGTGVLTRALALALPRAEIIATDLNQTMLDQAIAAGTPNNVTYRAADAQALPFDDAKFEVVVCQFGVMFFPDKPKAHAEARRVLKAGGTYIFNIWDRLEDNGFAHAITEALAQAYPDDPPRFLARTPYGYIDEARIEEDLEAGGFTDAFIEKVAALSRAPNARHAAEAYCHGTPLRGEIEARDPAGLEAATAAAERGLTRKFGRGAIEGKLRARVVSVQQS